MYIINYLFYRINNINLYETNFQHKSILFQIYIFSMQSLMQVHYVILITICTHNDTCDTTSILYCVSKENAVYLIHRYTFVNMNYIYK